MKRISVALVLSLALFVSLCLPGLAVSYVPDFISDGVNVEGAYTESAGEFSLTLEKQPKAAVSSLEGVSFDFKTDSAWGLITLTEQSKYNEAGLNGVGVKLRYDNGVEVTVMQPGESWGNVAIASYRVHADKTFNDNTYHTLSVSKTGGRWSITVDGLEVLGDNLTADGHTAVSALLDGAAYVSFGGNSYGDSCTVKPTATEADPGQTGGDTGNDTGDNTDNGEGGGTGTGNVNADTGDTALLLSVGLLALGSAVLLRSRRRV